MAANTDRGQLNRRETNFYLSPFAPGNSVSLDGFGRPVPRQPARFQHTGWIWCSITPPHILSAAIGSVPSLSGQTIAYRWRSLPRVRPIRAHSTQGSSSNECCLFRYHMNQLMCASIFPHPLYYCWYEVDICIFETEVLMIVFTDSRINNL